AEAVAVQRPLAEAVVEELFDQRLSVGQGDQALAKVAWGQDPVLLPKPAAGAAVVRDRYDRSQVGRVLLEPAEKGGHPRAAPDRHQARASAAGAEGVDQL